MSRKSRNFARKVKNEKSMKFLIHKSPDRKVQLDFAYEMMQAQQYYEWLNRDPLEIRWTMDASFKRIENPDEYTPIGTVEFVRAYMKKFYPEAAKKAMKPLNVPEVFYPDAGRSIGTFDMSKDDPRTLFPDAKKVFCKSATVIKHDGNGMYYMDALPKSGLWQISEYLDILSEWRVFVHNGQIQHIANYSGDCMVFPDAEHIREMVRMWSTIQPQECPKAYTLDVAVAAGRGTVVMEVHRFFSCGLYGFSDHNKIPVMFSQEWFEMKLLK